MKLFVTPWLPPIFLILLVLASFVITAFANVTSALFVFKFIYSLPFHILAFIVYLLAFVFIFSESRWRMSLLASVSCVFSLYVWWMMITIATSNFNISA